MNPTKIREASSDDAAAIAAIYNHYVLTTIISFEEEAVTAAAMAARIDDIAAAGLPWLVAESEGRVIGYAYASKWRVRPAYRFSVEVSAYVDADSTARGVGSLLYEALFASLKEKSVHVAIGGIALPNDKSVALHEKFGMRKVAHFSQVGYKFGEWRDVGYWEVVLGDAAK